MPLYEYRCSKCNHVFEVLQKFADEPVTVHEGCGGSVERLISAPAFHLKGTGWYATDYKKAPAAPVAGKADRGESKSDGGSSEESKSETAKSESKSTEKSDSKSSASDSSATPAPASTKTN